MVGKRIDVFISSTSIDLPEHRQAVINALLGMGLFPSGMEHWPAANENPVDFCRQKIEEAEIYIGIYAHRYGWRPGGAGTPSITEMEYDWATERRIPRYCFIIDNEYPWSPDKMELAAKDDLDAFKARVKQQIVGFFTTPDNLKAQVLQALAKHAQKQDISVTEPYMRRLHHDALQSGLLRSLDPRSKDPAFKNRTTTVDQVYTPLDTRDLVLRDAKGEIIWEKDDDSPMQRHDERTPLSAMEAANHFQHLVILGDPGSGKSTFVNFLALGLTGHLLSPKGDWIARLREQGWVQNALLPLHVTLRDFAQQMAEHSGTAGHLLDHIAHLMADCGCPEAMEAVKAVMREGKALLILDGLDEIPAEKRERVRDAVQMFMQAYDRCRVLITCRILSYANPDWQIPHTATVTLAPFDSDKIQHFIRAWYTAAQSMGTTDPDTASARITDLSKAVEDVKLRELATNPMLLTVMAIVHNHRGTLPRETARLYDACVEILMYKWKPDEARHLKEEIGLTDENDLYRILWQIAYEAHTRQADRVGAADISKAEVMEIVAEGHLQGSYAKAEIFCEYVEKRAGLLIGRGEAGSRQRVYAFPHRTFQEYLAGCYLADDMNFAECMDEKARAGANWRQVVLLATGHMYFNRSDRNQPLLAVQYLLNDPPKTDADWQAVVLAGEMLLIIGLPALEKHERLGRPLLRLARERLAALLMEGQLEPIERAAAGRILSELGDPRPGVGVKDGIPDIVWCEIPGGPFLFGSNQEKDKRAYEDEPDQHEVSLPTFRIAKYPVTYAQYEVFVQDGGYEKRDYWTEVGWNWKGDKLHPEWGWNDPEWHIANHPVVGVTWYEAVAFCNWLSAQVSPGSGVRFRLPTEAEFEKAARGDTDWIYPYGDAFDAHKGNTVETGIGRTSAVGIFPDGASRHGVLDISGNVWEWSLSPWANPYEPHTAAQVEVEGDARRVVRGGSWLDHQALARVSYRLSDYPFDGDNGLGFRLVSAPLYR